MVTGVMMRLYVACHHLCSSQVSGRVPSLRAHGPVAFILPGRLGTGGFCHCCIWSTPPSSSPPSCSEGGHEVVQLGNFHGEPRVHQHEGTLEQLVLKRCSKGIFGGTNRILHHRCQKHCRCLCCHVNMATSSSLLNTPQMKVLFLYILTGRATSFSFLVMWLDLSISSTVPVAAILNSG